MKTGNGKGTERSREEFNIQETGMDRCDIGLLQV
jgi:hypothetical protein